MPCKHRYQTICGGRGMNPTAGAKHLIIIIFITIEPNMKHPIPFMTKGVYQGSYSRYEPSGKTASIYIAKRQHFPWENGIYEGNGITWPCNSCREVEYNIFIFLPCFLQDLRLVYMTFSIPTLFSQLCEAERWWLSPDQHWGWVRIRTLLPLVLVWHMNPYAMLAFLQRCHQVG